MYKVIINNEAAMIQVMLPWASIYSATLDVVDMQEAWLEQCDHELVIMPLSDTYVGRSDGSVGLVTGFISSADQIVTNKTNVRQSQLFHGGTQSLHALVPMSQGIVLEEDIVVTIVGRLLSTVLHPTCPVLEIESMSVMVTGDLTEPVAYTEGVSKEWLANVVQSRHMSNVRQLLTSIGLDEILELADDIVLGIANPHVTRQYLTTDKCQVTDQYDKASSQVPGSKQIGLNLESKLKVDRVALAMLTLGTMADFINMDFDEIVNININVVGIAHDH